MKLLSFFKIRSYPSIIFKNLNVISSLNQNDNVSKGERKLSRPSIFPKSNFELYQSKLNSLKGKITKKIDGYAIKLIGNKWMQANGLKTS